MISIFASVCAFVLANPGVASVGGTVLGKLAYDNFKTTFGLDKLLDKTISFFKDESEAEKFVQALCEKETVNPHKPFRDVEDTFEEVTGRTYQTGLTDEITKWVQENKDQIESAAKVTLTHNTGITVGTQNAGKHIYNIAGDFKPNKTD